VPKRIASARVRGLRSLDPPQPALSPQVLGHRFAQDGPSVTQVHKHLILLVLV
jgi:hypothetical protein